MGYDYDALYGETPDALGEPSANFVRFFQKLNRTGLRVLDIGCGQGRDAIFIAELGHHVTGVDISANGIRDLNTAAKRRGLDISGITSDLRSYEPTNTFDILLIDRTLHMLPKPDREQSLARLLPCIRSDGWLLIADETKNFNDFEKALNAHSPDWTITQKARGYFFAKLKRSQSI